MATFTKADEIAVPQSVGPYTDGDVNTSEVLQVFQPHQGRDLLYKNPLLNNGSTEITQSLDNRIPLGTYTLNNRDYWENNNFNESTFQPYLKDNLETHDTLVEETPDGPIVRTAADNIYYNQYLGYSWSIDALPFVVNPNNDDIIHLDRYYDKDIDKEEYELATDGKINYYLSPRRHGRVGISGSSNIDIFSDRPPRTSGGGRNYFEWTITGTGTDAMENLSDNTDGSGMYLFKLNWGDGSELEYADKPQLLEPTTLFEHFYEKPGFYSITGVVHQIGNNGRNLYAWEKFQTNILLNPSPNYELNLYDYDNFASIGGISKDSSFIKSIYNMVGINPLTQDNSRASEEVIEELNTFDKLQILNVLGKVDYLNIESYYNFLSPYQTPTDNQTSYTFGCPDQGANNWWYRGPDFTTDDGRELPEGTELFDDGSCIYTYPVTVKIVSDPPDGLPIVYNTPDGQAMPKFTVDAALLYTYEGIEEGETLSDNQFTTYLNPANHIWFMHSTDELAEMDWYFDGWYEATDGRDDYGTLLSNSVALGGSWGIDIPGMQGPRTIEARFYYQDTTPPLPPNFLNAHNKSDDVSSYNLSFLNNSLNILVPTSNHTDLDEVLIYWKNSFLNDEPISDDFSHFEITRRWDNILGEEFTVPVATVSLGEQTEWLDNMINAGNQFLIPDPTSPTGGIILVIYPNGWVTETEPVQPEGSNWTWTNFQPQESETNSPIGWTGHFSDSDDVEWEFTGVTDWIDGGVPTSGWDSGFFTQHPFTSTTFTLTYPSLYSGTITIPASDSPTFQYGIYDRDLPYQEYTYEILSVDTVGHKSEVVVSSTVRPTPSDLVPVEVTLPDEPIVQITQDELARQAFKFQWNPVNEFTEGIEDAFSHYEIHITSRNAPWIPSYTYISSSIMETDFVEFQSYDYMDYRDSIEGGNIKTRSISPGMDIEFNIRVWDQDDDGEPNNHSGWTTNVAKILENPYPGNIISLNGNEDMSDLTVSLSPAGAGYNAGDFLNIDYFYTTESPIGNIMITVCKRVGSLGADNPEGERFVQLYKSPETENFPFPNAHKALSPAGYGGDDTSGLSPTHNGTINIPNGNPDTAFEDARRTFQGDIGRGIEPGDVLWFVLSIDDSFGSEAFHQVDHPAIIDYVPFTIGGIATPTITVLSILGVEEPNYNDFYQNTFIHLLPNTDPPPEYKVSFAIQYYTQDFPEGATLSFRVELVDVRDPDVEGGWTFENPEVLPTLQDGGLSEHYIQDDILLNEYNIEGGYPTYQFSLETTSAIVYGAYDTDQHYYKYRVIIYSPEYGYGDEPWLNSTVRAEFPGTLPDDIVANGLFINPTYTIQGCMDPNATNYNSEAMEEDPDNPCVYEYFNLSLGGTYGGTTEPSGTQYDTQAGTVVEIQAIPETQPHHYVFTHWSGDTENIGHLTSAITEVVMEGNYSIIANFELAEG